METNVNEKNEINETEEKKGIKAKGASLYAQIAAAVWIAGWNGAQFVRDLITGTRIDTMDVLFSGVAIAACFMPVYFNLIMDKIKDIKTGGK